MYNELDYKEESDITDEALTISLEFLIFYINVNMKLSSRFQKLNIAITLNFKIELISY